MIAFQRLLAVLMVATSALAMQQPSPTYFPQYPCPISQCNTAYDDCFECLNHLMLDHQGIHYQCMHCSTFSSTNILALLDHRANCLTKKQQAPITPVYRGLHIPAYYQVSASPSGGICYASPNNTGSLSELFKRMLILEAINKKGQQPQYTPIQESVAQPPTPCESLRTPSPDAADWQELTDVLQKDGYCGHTSIYDDPMYQTEQIISSQPMPQSLATKTAGEHTVPRPSPILPSIHTEQLQNQNLIRIPIIYVKNSSKPYTCPLSECNQIFMRIQLFDQHFTQNHPNYMLMCYYCKRYTTISLWGIICHSNYCRERKQPAEHFLPRIKKT